MLIQTLSCFHTIASMNEEGGHYVSKRNHQICNDHMGKCVYITENCGKRHYGRIVNVDRDNVYIQPLGNRGFSYGYGYGGYGGYGGFGYGIGYPIALGAIAGIALAGLFFW